MGSPGNAAIDILIEVLRDKPRAIPDPDPSFPVPTMMRTGSYRDLGLVKPELVPRPYATNHVLRTEFLGSILFAVLWHLHPHGWFPWAIIGLVTTDFLWICYHTVPRIWKPKPVRGAPWLTLALLASVPIFFVLQLLATWMGNGDILYGIPYLLILRMDFERSEFLTGRLWGQESKRI